MSGAQIEQVRSFNRIVTQTIGALQQDYLGRHRPLGESRLLFEIGENGATASELRARLELDSGYLSRLLRSLEAQRLVETVADERDKRVRRVALTEAGRKELHILDRDSDRLAQGILDPLNDAQKSRLVSAMTVVKHLLTASAVRIEQVSPGSRAADQCLASYFSELAQRFERGFDPEQSLSPTLEGFVPPDGVFLIMRLYGTPVGCGGFKREPGNSAYIKRMWVSPDARGLGLGRRMLQELEDRARAMGYRKLILETEKSLIEAQSLYRSSGFHEVAPFNDEHYAHYWFEKPL